MSKGLTVKIIDVPMEKVVRNKVFWKNRDKLISDIKTRMLFKLSLYNPKLIGISCYSTECDEARELIEDIRKMTQAKIIVGGIHPTLYPDDFKDIADYCYKGRLDNGYPDYSLVDMEYYTNANPYAIRGVFLRCAYILASFGCPSQCTFCVAKRLREYFGREQIKDPRALVKEILFLKDNYAIDGFYFIDDLYTLNKENVLEFCKLIKPTGFLWGCSSKVSTLNEEVIKAMSEANCIQIDFGVERGSDEALKKLKKGQSIFQIKEVFKWCRKYGIRTFANFLVGLPEEDEQDRKNIEQLIREIQPTVISLNYFEPYQGTEIYDTGFRQTKSVSLERYIGKTQRKYNSLWTNLYFHFTWRYIRTILKSKRKGNYLKQLWILLQETINQQSA